MIASPPQAALPERVASWVRADGGPHALLLITVDHHARGHVTMLARDEVVVVSLTRLRVALGETSRSAENLRLRTSATLAIYDADLACVVKTHAMGGARTLGPGTVAYDLAVEEVRLDTPAASEASARLVTGLRFEGRAARDDIQAKLASFDR